ncbi:hypothetical protein LBMAG42_40590 [Deltaproteobacteria bacterium]|nr:hypothetical protein LBMAG42_40590 [Deltaproteobacteria bacterium]
MNRGNPWLWVVLSACALFVPVPFLDDYLARRALRRALRYDAPEAEPIDEPTVDVLTDDRASMLMGCLKMMLLWPVKKLFRTVFWFLTVKDVLDRVAYGAQVLSMVRLARAQGWLPGNVRAVRDAMEVTFGKHRASPITRVILRDLRPEIAPPTEVDLLARASHALRRHAGGALMDQLFLDRVRDEIGGPDAAIPADRLPGPPRQR